MSNAGMILLLETIDPQAEALLRDAGPVVLSPSPAPLDHDLAFDEVAAIVTRGRGRLDDALMARCPALRVVARCGTGLDNVDSASAARRGIKVIHAPGVNAGAVAEHVMMFVLMLVRRGHEGARAVSNGDWGWRETYDGDDIAGKVLGIAGYGQVGRKVADLAGAFGLSILVHDPCADAAPFEAVSFDALLARSDIVTLHMPLTDATRDLIDADNLARMKRGSYLVNTARGGLVDEAAVVDALNGGQLSGYAADVVRSQPPAPDDPLCRHPKSIITPHVSALTAGTYRIMCLRTAENVVKILSGAAPDPGTLFKGGG